MNFFTKERVLSLLREGDIDGTSILEQDNVTLENIIFYIHSYKLDVDEQFFRKLAKELGLPFMEREKLLEKSNLVPTLPFDLVKDQLMIFIQITPESVVIATANPFNTRLLEQIELLFQLKVDVHIASSQSIEEANESGYREIHKYHALKELIDRNPDESAYRVLYKWQQKMLLVIFFLGYALFFMDGIFALVVVFTLINLFYFIFNPVKFYISLQGFIRGENYLSITKEEIQKLDESTLPVYTILIPLYKEAQMLPNILQNMSRLDYPRDRLDVKILLEEVDTETVEEARRLGLFGNPHAVIEPMSLDEYREFLKIFEPVVVPNADIRTKPRACNHGLLRAKGDLCVVFDAEDVPDPDQLKKAVILFEKIGEEYACIQARLSYYNPDDNILTRWFTIEYSYWFDFYLEGLYLIGCPVPLGGTSNHFRTKPLKKVGAWDPYNVTEDADLGIRISRRKLKVCTMDSYTYEEANGHLFSWIKQRSRWNKGHAQTYFLHMRKPRELLEELGWKQFFLFQVTFGGNVLLPLINPIMWIITLLTLMAPNLISYEIAFPVMIMCIVNTFVSNLVYIGIHLISCIRKKMYREIPYALVIPIYWVLLSIGAWRGLFQLLTKPFFWEKTVHGTNKNFKRAVTSSAGIGDKATEGTFAG